MGYSRNYDPIPFRKAMPMLAQNNSRVIKAPTDAPNNIRVSLFTCLSLQKSAMEMIGAMKAKYQSTSPKLSNASMLQSS